MIKNVVQVSEAQSKMFWNGLPVIKDYKMCDSLYKMGSFMVPSIPSAKGQLSWLRPSSTGLPFTFKIVKS